MPLPDFHPSYITLRVEGEIIIAAFRLTRITEDENIEQLGRELFTPIDKYEYRKMVLSMDGVEFVTSSVIGKMIALHRKLHRQEGTLVICNLGKGMGDVLRTSRLIDYFNVADDVDAAITRLVKEL